MLIINEQEMDVFVQEIKVGEYIVNGEKGYNINISLKFNKENKGGYLNLSAGYKLENDINKFLNRHYKSVPFFDKKEEINWFEIYDTEKYYDTEIESEIYLNIKDKVENKIEVAFEINDELIKIKYKGLLNIKR